MRKINYFAFILLLIVKFSPINARDLIKTVALHNPLWMLTDESGNIYVVNQKNSLIKFNSNGDSVNYYQSIKNGGITYIDVTNPLKTMLYYDDYLKITLLDRMLTESSELDIKQLGISNTHAAGMSRDGNLWLYDYNNAQLKKYDLSGNQILASNDLRQTIDFVPNPTYLLEYNMKVYLVDIDNGILTFDRYGGYLNTLDIKDVPYIQVIGDQIIYKKGNQLIAQGLTDFKEKIIDLPTDEDIISVQMQVGRLYILHKNHLDIFQN